MDDFFERRLTLHTHHHMMRSPSWPASGHDYDTQARAFAQVPPKWKTHFQDRSVGTASGVLRLLRFADFGCNRGIFFVERQALLSKTYGRTEPARVDVGTLQG